MNTFFDIRKLAEIYRWIKNVENNLLENNFFQNIWLKLGFYFTIFLMTLENSGHDWFHNVTFHDDGKNHCPLNFQLMLSSLPSDKQIKPVSSC